MIPILPIMPRYKECQLQRLLLVQSRIAIRRIIQAQILVFQPNASTGALGDSLACELQMHTAEVGVVCFVDAERGG